MKPLLWIGLILLILGIASLVVPIPHSQRHGVTVGDLSLGVETQTEDKVSTTVSVAMILGGLGVMAIGTQRSS